jgi:hypothetical protein
LLLALIEYVPAAAPDLGRMMNVSHDDGEARVAPSAYEPDESAVTNWLVLVSWSVPAFGSHALANVDAALAEVPLATRFVFDALATTYLPELTACTASANRHD